MILLDIANLFNSDDRSELIVISNSKGSELGYLENGKFIKLIKPSSNLFEQNILCIRTNINHCCPAIEIVLDI